MGDIADRREAALTALAGALADDMEHDFANWPLAWQELGSDQPHNPIAHTALAGLDGFAATAARRYAGYGSAAWATDGEWATVGAAVGDGEQGLVCVSQVSVCCDVDRCYGACGLDARPRLKHRLLFNRDQTEGDVEVAVPPPPMEWGADSLKALLGGLAVRWVFGSGPASYESGTVATPPPEDCASFRSFASEAIRGHALWALGECSQSSSPTVAQDGLEHELAAELSALFVAGHLGIRYEPGLWASAAEWPASLRSPAGWGVLLSAGSVALAGASLLVQAAAAAQSSAAVS